MFMELRSGFQDCRAPGKFNRIGKKLSMNMPQGNEGDSPCRATSFCLIQGTTTSRFLPEYLFDYPLDRLGGAFVTP